MNRILQSSYSLVHFIQSWFLTHYRIVKVVLYAPLKLSPSPTLQRVGESWWSYNFRLTGSYFRLTGQQINRKCPSLLYALNFLISVFSQLRFQILSKNISSRWFAPHFSLLHNHLKCSSSTENPTAKQHFDPNPIYTAVCKEYLTNRYILLDAQTQHYVSCTVWNFHSTIGNRSYGSKQKGTILGNGADTIHYYTVPSLIQNDQVIK